MTHDKVDKTTHTHDYWKAQAGTTGTVPPDQKLCDRRGEEATRPAVWRSSRQGLQTDDLLGMGYNPTAVAIDVPRNHTLVAGERLIGSA